MNPRHVLITGASSGIGAALARVYAQPGARLSLTARNAARLDETADACRSAGADVVRDIADVTDANALARWIEACDAQSPIDIIFANAGVGGERVIATTEGESLDVAQEIIATNILGVANTIVPIIPRFVARKKGHIVIMSSLAALFALPQAPLYSASKAAVRVYGHGLRRLLTPKGITVTVICPGFVDTPMSASVPDQRPFLWNSGRAARHIANGIERRKAEISFPWPLAILAKVANAVPASLLHSAFAGRNRS